MIDFLTHTKVFNMQPLTQNSKLFIKTEYVYFPVTKTLLIQNIIYLIISRSTELACMAA